MAEVHMFGSSPKAEGSLSNAARISYGLPAMAHAFVALPLYTIIPAYYAAHTNVTLAQIGMVVALAGIFDALADPVIGFWSDRVKARYSTRKPFLVISMIFCAVSAAYLFQPPPDATIVYFCVWSMLLYVGFSLFEVPHSAWGAELSRDYNVRSKIGVTKAKFNVAGSLSTHLLPIAMSVVTGTAAIGTGTLLGISNLYVFLFPAFMLIAIFVVPDGVKLEAGKGKILDIVKILFSSKVVVRFFSTTVLWGLGQGITMSTVYIFMTGYLGLDKQFPYIMATLFLCQIGFLSSWSKILQKLDRHKIWAIGIGTMALLGPTLLLLPRGGQALIPLLLLTVIKAFFSAPANFVPAAILGDVIDYDSLKTGVPKAGSLFALQMLLIRISMAIGGGLAFFALDRAGYRVGQVNSAEADRWLLCIYIGGPMLFHLAMAYSAWTFPITRKRHLVIQKRLEARAKRQEALA